MKRQIQPGSHLDADQISVFVEGVATPREREEVLSHLAQCAECRDAVFLLETPGNVSTVTAQTQERPAWQRWFMPIGFAGVALAAGITMVVVLRPHQPTPGKVHEEAAVKHPDSIGRPSAPAANQLASPRGDYAKGTPHKQSAAVPPPAAASGGGLLPTKQKEMALASALPAPAASPGSAPFTNLKSKAPAPAPEVSAKALPPSGGLASGTGLGSNRPSRAKGELQSNLQALRIEHDRGPADGSSEVNGRVTDLTGTIITGATVTLRDSTGATRRATSSYDGKFNIPAVPAGHYELSVSARGFQTSQQAIDLKPRDQAMLDSVLNVGASTQTVKVEAPPPYLETEAAQVNALAVAPNLPSQLAPVNTVTNGKTLLSLDSAGALFLSRNGGKSWKKIKPQWPGKATKIELVNQTIEKSNSRTREGSQRAAAALGPAVFQITTDSGAHWISENGKHWLAR